MKKPVVLIIGDDMKVIKEVRGIKARLHWRRARKNAKLGRIVESNNNKENE